MESSHKRQCVNTNGDSSSCPALPAPTVLVYDLPACIDALHNHGNLQKPMMLQLTIADPSFVRKIYVDILAVEQARIIDFDHYSKSIRSTINKKYRSLSSSRAYDISCEVHDRISENVRLIADQAGKERASFGTRRSGLETLRKIAKTICLSSMHIVGHEVQLHFEQNTCLDDTMYAIVEAMGEDGRK